MHSYASLCAHRPGEWICPGAGIRVPDVLSQMECEELIVTIAPAAPVICGGADAELAARLHQLLTDLLAVDPGLSEYLQGQRYAYGQSFKEYTDRG